MKSFREYLVEGRPGDSHQAEFPEVSHYSDDPHRVFTASRHAYFHPIADLELETLLDATGVLISGSLSLHAAKFLTFKESVNLTFAQVAALRAQGYDGVINDEGQEVVAFSPAVSFHERTRELVQDMASIKYLLAKGYR